MRVLKPWLQSVKTVLIRWIRGNALLWWLFGQLRRLRTVLMPHQLNGWLGLASTYIENENWMQAEVALRQAVTVAPLDGLPHACLGMVFAWQGNFLEAERHLRKALELVDSTPNRKLSIEHGWHILAVEELKVGLGAEAEAHIAMAGAISSDPVGYYSNAWMTLVGWGYPDFASRIFEFNRQAQLSLRERLRIQNSTRRYLGKFWSIQIGHLAHLDGYLKIGMLGWRSPQENIMLAGPDTKGNRFFLNLWKPHLTQITPSEAISASNEEVQACEDYLSMHEIHGRGLWAPIAAAKAQKQWDLEGRAPLLKLDPVTVRQGCEALGQLGIPPGAWIVGLHVREAGFHGKSDSASQGVRNAEIATYIQAIKAIVRRGGWVIRMGDPSMTRLPRLPGVVDYAHSKLRSDWMDVFVCAHSRFFIGTQSGLSQVPNCFGVPTIYTNWVSLAIPPWYIQNLFIPKLFFAKEKSRLLTFLEILETRLSFLVAPLILKQGIYWIDNSAQEINDVAEEMMDRLDGRGSPGDDCHQQDWADLAEKHGVIVNSRMGQNFLMNHLDLFQHGRCSLTEQAA